MSSTSHQLAAEVGVKRFFELQFAEVLRKKQKNPDVPSMEGVSLPISSIEMKFKKNCWLKAMKKNWFIFNCVFCASLF